ncbi:MAG TPA: hypothetical protein VFL84_11305 [Gammaproteobacteria bacterium]|nr:hypothetical protein [Gammaproteobacteria bacterium]
MAIEPMLGAAEINGRSVSAAPEHTANNARNERQREAPRSALRKTLCRTPLVIETMVRGTEKRCKSAQPAEKFSAAA